MKVLVACEESQTVCKAFRELGHDAYSCDIQEPSGFIPQYHLLGDVRNYLQPGRWDLLIGHPPCTYLSKVGAQHLDKPGRRERMEEAIDFFLMLKSAPVEKICLENPVPLNVVAERIGRYTQKIQPYYFGDPHMKTTCLWLKGLPKLQGLIEVASDPMKFKPKPLGYNGRGNPYYFSDSKGGSKERSKTFPSIARAMATQWGGLHVPSISESADEVRNQTQHNK